MQVADPLGGIVFFELEIIRNKAAVQIVNSALLYVCQQFQISDPAFLLYVPYRNLCREMGQLPLPTSNIRIELRAVASISWIRIIIGNVTYGYAFDSGRFLGDKRPRDHSLFHRLCSARAQGVFSATPRRRPPLVLSTYFVAVPMLLNNIIVNSKTDHLWYRFAKINHDRVSSMEAILEQSIIKDNVIHINEFFRMPSNQLFCAYRSELLVGFIYYSQY